MSNLKHLTLRELEDVRNKCRAEVGALQGKINNVNTKLYWVNTYIVNKTPVEYTIEDLNKIMGHPVIIK